MKNFGTKYIKNIRGMFSGIILIMSSLVFSGCSMMPSPVDLLMPDKPSIEVNAAIGKNVEQDKSVIKIESGKTTKQEAEKISNDTAYTAEVVNQVSEHIPPWILGLLILFAGWLIPEPSKCANIGKDIIFGALNGLIVKPIKGIADFVLLLFGRERL